MPERLEDLTAYLDDIGLSDVQHTHADLLSHLVRVHELLEEWQMPGYVCRAGLFHSVYGTEGFPRRSLSLSCRDELRRLIGRRAERLAYAYCAMTYDSLETSVAEQTTDLIDRFQCQKMHLSLEEYLKVLWIKLADAIEQASEKTWQSQFFADVAKTLGRDGQDRWIQARFDSTSSTPRGV